MPGLDDLRDLAARLRQAEDAATAARDKRDDTIRAVRRSTSHTVPEIAAAAGVSVATVKSVLRGAR
jgi:DNA-binding transcriptional regulator YiaG